MGGRAQSLAPVTQAGEELTHWTSAHWTTEIWQPRVPRWHTVRGAWTPWGGAYGDVRPHAPLKTKRMCLIQAALSWDFTKPHLPPKVEKLCGRRRKMAAMGRHEQWSDKETMKLSLHVTPKSLWHELVLSTGSTEKDPGAVVRWGCHVCLPQPTVTFSELLQTGC